MIVTQKSGGKNIRKRFLKQFSEVPVLSCIFHEWQQRWSYISKKGFGRGQSRRSGNHLRRLFRPHWLWCPVWCRSRMTSMSYLLLLFFNLYDFIQHHFLPSGAAGREKSSSYDWGQRPWSSQENRFSTSWLLSPSGTRSSSSPAANFHLHQMWAVHHPDYFIEDDEIQVPENLYSPEWRWVAHRARRTGVHQLTTSGIHTRADPGTSAKLYFPAIKQLIKEERRHREIVDATCKSLCLYLLFLEVIKNKVEDSQWVAFSWWPPIFCLLCFTKGVCISTSESEICFEV